jgi:Ca2+-binding EF-hand superfamily protein
LTAVNFYCKTLIDPSEFFKLGLEKQRRILERQIKPYKKLYLLIDIHQMGLIKKLKIKNAKTSYKIARI